LLVVTAAGLTLVVSQTNAATPMSEDLNSSDYSPHAIEREAGTSITTMIVIFLWCASALMALVCIGLVLTMFL
jgi:hypothetical protein